MDVVGWVWSVRDLGGIKFVLIRVFPHNSVEQVVVSRNTKGAGCVLHPETLILAKGEWKETDKFYTGREFHAEEIRIIKQSNPTPFDLTEKTPADFSTRIKYRYLDIRKPKVCALFRVKAKIVDAARNFLKEEGFTELHFPIIISTAAEGGAGLFPVIYFDKEAYLAQSPQLYKQSAVPSFGKVFSIDPSFRAEKSRTRKHLTEFWQIDVEGAFLTEKDLMEIQFNIYRRASEAVLDECERELGVLGATVVVPEGYSEVSYEEALDVLWRKGFDVEWGDDFGAPEERALCSEFEEPFFITEFPESECAFYYKLKEEDPRYAKRIDFLSPGEKGMELSSGGPREEDPKKLRESLERRGLSPEAFEWYLDMFRYGFPPHAGFGMGVERLTASILGLEKVMEVALYPRTPDILTP